MRRALRYKSGLAASQHTSGLPLSVGRLFDCSL
jgi:hypothetical protein